jgi:nucleotide-binding universal stress UspA family protein
MVSKLLCATDGSHSSEKAVTFAVSLAKSLGVPLTFFTVTTIGPERASHSAFWDANVLEAVDAQIHRELHQAKAVAERAGVRDVRCVAAEGRNIPETIVAFAKQDGADHIVTGSAGHRGAARILLGSVAEAVVRSAHCPVTVVR